MKKGFIFLCMTVVSLSCLADQLALISKEQAMKATFFLQQHEELILWCACCDTDNSKEVIKVTEVFCEPAGYEDYYHVMLKGSDKNGNSVLKELDLAYVHCKSDNTALCVGVALGFECDPCTDPFNWTDRWK
jgi:hypothetical protein